MTSRGNGYALIGIRLHGAAEVVAWGLEGPDGSSDQPLYSKLWDRLRPVRREYAAVLFVPMRYGRIDIRAVGDIRTVTECWPFVTERPAFLETLSPDKRVQ
jgi:hypothetical protein